MSGTRTLVRKNDDFLGFETDDAFNVRYARKSRADGGVDLMIADGKGGFAEFQTIALEDSHTTHALRFDKAGVNLYMVDSRGRDTSALVALDTKTNQTKVIAEDARADIDAIMTSPVDGHVQAASFEYDRRNWKVVDKSIEPGFVLDGDLGVVSRSLDDKTWRA